MKVTKATPEAIAEAAAALRRGELVAFPTETVYGLGADATNARAVAAIFEAKGRPRFNPLIVHVADRGGGRAPRQADRAWPAAGRRVLAGAADAGAAAAAGLSDRRSRDGRPRHRCRARSGAPDRAALLAEAGVPVAAPSANRSGHVSPTTAAHVAADLGDRVAMILDGGPTAVGLESTVVDVTGSVPVILRRGGVTREAIARVIGRADRGGDRRCRQAGLARHAGAALRAGDAFAAQCARCARRRGAAGIRCARAAACAVP